MQKTVVTFLLDRTGSMQDCKEATIEAFNAYLKTLQEGDRTEVELIEFTFLQFDSSQGIYKVCVAEQVDKVALLTNKTYECLASTPLVDSAYKTIKAVEEALQKRTDNPKVVICIQTDGFENASTQYTMAQLNQLIKEKVALGWQFNFMGASIDAYAQSTAMGISASATLGYNKSNKRNTSTAFGAAARATKSYVSGQSLDTNYTMAERLESGDAHCMDYLNPDGTAKQTPTQPVQQSATTTTLRSPKPSIVDDITL